MNINYGANVGEYPHSVEELIEYFGRVAVECVDDPKKKRLMGIALSVVENLERQQKELALHGV